MSWKKSNGFLWGFFFWADVTLVLFSLNCSKTPKPPETLQVRIVNASNEIQPGVFMEAIKGYAATIPGLIAGATVETVAPDIPETDISQVLTGCDVVIFPSILDKQIRSYSDSFYPLSASDTVSFPVFNQAYAAAAPVSVWALPLVLDPVVMVYNQAVLDQLMRPSFAGDWAEFYYVCELLQRDKKITPPYLMFLSGNPLRLADSLAALQFTFGYEYYAVQSVSPSRELPPAEMTAKAGRAMKHLKALLSSTPSEALTDLPHVADLAAFIAAKGFVTFARYSEFIALLPEKRSQLRAIPILSSEKPTTICYGIAAAVPTESANPTRGRDLIRYLVSQGSIMAEKIGLIQASWLAGEVPKFPILNKNAFFVPREDSKILDSKLILELLNGNLSIEEFSDHWRVGFFIPTSRV